MLRADAGRRCRVDFDQQHLIFFVSSNRPISISPGSTGERFETILSQPRFEALRAVLGHLSTDREALFAAILGTDTYEQFLARFGRKLVLTRQVHVQDCYSRVGPEGGIKAVLPYYDIPTQSSLPTLVNFDGTLTTTPKSAAFFDALLPELKKQLLAQT
jgi:hypothetical protein